MNRIVLGTLCGIGFGVLDGLMVVLPDALAMKSYVGILGTGLVFGALAGWAAKMWAT